MIEEYDNKQIYCRMLGHPISFSYCRKCNIGTPCRSIYNCWFEYIDITTFMDEHFSTDLLEQIKAPPKDKTVSIHELIKKAKKSN